MAVEPRPLRTGAQRPKRCCGSSVVEHSLGKGEVESSILSHSTIFLLYFKRLVADFVATPFAR